MKKIFAIFLEKKKLNQLMSKDWLLKLVSLGLAIILWYFVGGEDRIDKNVMVPIEIINLPRDLVISNQFKKEIEVTVSGPRSLIVEMANRAVSRQVDLSTATPGTMVIENDSKHIPVLRGITVQRVQPSSIILSLDKLIEKKFPVEARIVGRVAHGYSIKNIKIDPELITIAGPFTTLSQVDHFSTKNITVDGVKQSTQLQVPLKLETSIVELIGETSVTVDIIVALETEAITFEAMKVNAILDGRKIEVQPEQVRVVANVPKLLLDKKLDVKSLLTAGIVKNEGDGNLKVKIIPRADLEMPIEIVSVVPDTVKIAGMAGGSTGQKSLEAAKTLTEDDKQIKTSPAEQPKIVQETVEDGASSSKTARVKSIKKTKSKIIR